MSDRTQAGEGDAFLPHRQATTEGDPRSGEQSEEDRELDRAFVRDGYFGVEDGRVDDPEEDQQHRGWKCWWL